MSGKKQGKSGGVGVGNAKQGARSEYLAHYVMSAIGPSWPIPRTEDIGLDLIGSIGIPGTGREKGKRTYAGVGYAAQIKSGGGSIVLKGEQAIHWLRRLQMPLFIVIVRKRDQRISIYTTWNLHQMICRCFMEKAKPVVPKKISLVLEKEPTNPEINQSVPDKEFAKVPVGKPILSFPVADVDDEAKLANIRDVFRFWVELDSRNYALRTAGVPLYLCSSQWQTNVRPPDQDDWRTPYSRDYCLDALSIMAWASHPLMSFFVRQKKEAKEEPARKNAALALDALIAFWKKFVNTIPDRRIQNEITKTISENPTKEQS